MPVDDLEPLRALCDQILLENMPTGLRVQVARLHAKGISRKTLGKLIKKVGGTVTVQMQCDALWCALEFQRLGVDREL